jgi:NitT/TauT family transport system substrate-binding protein
MTGSARLRGRFDAKLGGSAKVHNKLTRHKHSGLDVEGLAILRLNNSKAKPTATGAMPATLTQVMSGQIDIGFAVPPMGLQQLEDGKIWIIGRASDVPGSQNQTVRTMVANAAKLAQNPALMTRFVAAYAETIDWMYSSDPKVLQYYEDFSKTPRRFADKLRKEFYLKEMLDPYRISGLDAAMDEAIKANFCKRR